MQITKIYNPDGTFELSPESRQELLAYIARLEKEEKKWKATENFDPDTQVIVTKEQLDLTQQLQSLSKLVSMETTLQAIKEKVDTSSDIGDQVKEIHAVHTGKLFTKKEKLSKKELEKARIDKLLTTGHFNMLSKSKS